MYVLSPQEGGGGGGGLVIPLMGQNKICRLVPQRVLKSDTTAVTIIEVPFRVLSRKKIWQNNLCLEWFKVGTS